MNTTTSPSLLDQLKAARVTVDAAEIAWASARAQTEAARATVRAAANYDAFVPAWVALGDAQSRQIDASIVHSAAKRELADLRAALAQNDRFWREIEAL